MIYKRPTPVIVQKQILDPSDQCWKQRFLRVTEIQKISKGAGAILGYIDDGVGINKELLDLKIERWSFFQTSNPIGDHSTIGVTLVCGKNMGIFPEMQIVSKQVIDPDSGIASTNEVIAAIYKAKDLGIQTINLSLGSDRPDEKLEIALADYVSDGVSMAVISAGNDGPAKNTSDWPANYAKKYKGVISIAATQQDRLGAKITAFSSRGIITISAPGAGLKSMKNDNEIEYGFGTSYSAPIVSSSISVARTLINRNLYQDEILDLLKNTSDSAYAIADGGFGNINIVGFLKAVKSLPSTYVAKMEQKKKSLCEKIKSFFI